MSDSKTVFALRKQGKINEALELGRKVFQQNASDNWNVRAFGWSLHDAIKGAGQDKNFQLQNDLIEELLSLPVSNEDEVLFKTCNYWRGRLQSGLERNSDLKHISDLRKKGQLADAWNLIEEILGNNPEDGPAWAERGWILFSFLKAELALDKSGSDRVGKILQQYQSQQKHDKPGLLHSMMLNLAVRAHRSEIFEDFISFFQWWEPSSSYRKEDYDPFVNPSIPIPPTGGKPQSLVEKAASALNRAIQDSTKVNQATLEWADRTFKDLIDNKPDHLWAPLWRSKTLSAMNKTNEARALLIPFARTKSSQSWVWKGLAETYPVKEDMHLALLSQAYFCGQSSDEIFNLSIYQMLADVFNLRQQYPQSLYFLERIQSVRLNKKYSTDNIDQQMTQDIFENVTSASEPEIQKCLKDWAISAQDILTEGLPQGSGIYLGEISSKYNNPPGGLIGILQNGSLHTALTPKGLQLPDSLKPGSPLQVKFDKRSEQFHAVTAHSKEGELWEGVSPIFGVVDHVNNQKQLTCVEIGQQKPVLMYHDRVSGSEKLLPGSKISMFCAHSGIPQKLQAFHFEESDDPDPNWLKRSSGKISLNSPNPFGFVETHEGGSAFVSPALVQRKHLKNGDDIEFTMIRKWNKTRNQMGWSVINVH